MAIETAAFHEHDSVVVTVPLTPFVPRPAEENDAPQPVLPPQPERRQTPQKSSPSSKRKRRASNYRKSAEVPWENDPALLKRNCISPGSAKFKRWEGLVDLLRTTEVLEEDFYPNTHREDIYSRIFEDPQLLQVWDQFMRSSEEQQAAIISHSSRKVKNSGPVLSHSHNNAANGYCSAEECFCLVHRDNRKLLRRANVPMELLRRFEGDVRQFITHKVETEDYDFCSDMASSLQVEALETDAPVGIPPPKFSDNGSCMIWYIQDGYARRLAHAVCQYYQCSSQTEMLLDGTRATTVRLLTSSAAASQFPMFLTDFLLSDDRKS